MNISLIDFIKCIFFRIFYLVLAKVYKFDKWHISGSYYCKPYKKQLIKIINDLEFNSILDLGCGLGDIINRVKMCPNKFACDIDPRVIGAAKFLNSRLYKTNINFFTESFQLLIENKIIKDKKIDIIIMINWSHNINKNDLSLNLKKIIKESKCNYIIVDGIKKKYQNRYKYCHAEKFWSNFGKIKSKANSIDMVRNFYVIKILN